MLDDKINNILEKLDVDLKTLENANFWKNQMTLKKK